MNIYTHILDIHKNANVVKLKSTMLKIKQDTNIDLKWNNIKDFSVTQLSVSAIGCFMQVNNHQIGIPSYLMIVNFLEIVFWKY